jgi:hypothetical protein
MKIQSVLFLILCLLMTACNVPRPVVATETNPRDIETVVASTTQALTEQAAVSLPAPTSTPTDSLPPTFTPTLTPNITFTPEPGFGFISGNIYGYPYGNIPQLSIVAFGQQPPYNWWYLIIGAGSTFFSMDDGGNPYVSSGKYRVVAYDSSGHTGGCTTIIEVKNNEMVTCDITNWGGGYPAKPAGIP